MKKYAPLIIFGVDSYPYISCALLRKTYFAIDLKFTINLKPVCVISSWVLVSQLNTLATLPTSFDCLTLFRM